MINSFSGQYYFLSNFYPSCIYLKVQNDWIACRTVEHAFQASKTIYPRQQLEIISAETPGKAKRLGRQLILRNNWEDIKINIMRQLLMQKFADVDLRVKLLATGDEELVEGNYWHDNFYGDCRCEKCKNIQGKNILGTLLMEERERIKKTLKGD